MSGRSLSLVVGADFDEFSGVISIKPIGRIGFESDKKIKVAIAVKIGPAIGLPARRRKKVGLNRLEPGIRGGRAGAASGERGQGGDPQKMPTNKFLHWRGPNW